MFYKQRSVFRHGSQVVCEIFFCLNSAFLRSILVAQIISPVIFDTDHSFTRQNALFLTKHLFIKVFYDALFTFSYFLLQGKVLCFARVNKSLARCLFVICRKRSEHLVEKKLSLVVFDSNCSFKTVKCSFFNQIIVYQSFYGVPLTFNYVLLQGKVLCFARVGKLLVRYLLSEAADQTWWKKLYLWSYLTQIVHSNGKKLFLQTNNC